METEQNSSLPQTFKFLTKFSRIEHLVAKSLTPQTLSAENLPEELRENCRWFLSLPLNHEIAEADKGKWEENIGKALESINLYFSDPSFEDSGLKKGGLLHEDLRKKLDTPEGKKQIANFMKNFLEYVSILCKIPKNAALMHLRQFPSAEAEQYACFGGTSSRMIEVLSILKSESIEVTAHHRLVEKYAIQLRNIIRVVNHPHVIPCLNFLLGVNLNVIKEIDGSYVAPLSDIPKQKIWEMMIRYEIELNQELDKIIEEKASKIADLMEENFKEKVFNAAGNEELFPTLKEMIKQSGIAIGDDPQEVEFIYYDDQDHLKLKNSSELRKIIKGRLQEKTKSISAAEEEDLNSLRDSGVYRMPIQHSSQTNNIVELISSKDPNEREFGLKALRILGELAKEEDDFQFLAIIRLLSERHSPADQRLLAIYQELEAGIEEEQSRKEESYLDPILIRIKDRFDYYFRRFDEVNRLKLFQALTSLYLNRPEEIDQSVVNYESNEHRTLLHYAAKNNYTEIVLRLLENGANANIMDSQNLSPIFYAAKNGNVLTTKALLNKLMELLDQSQLKAILNHKDIDGCTMIFYAAKNDHTEVVNLLLENGADASLRANNNATPLYIAAQNGHTEVVRLLLEKGVEPNPIANNDVTALHAAAQNGHTEVVQLLLENGVEPNPRANNDATPLHLAAQSGRTKIVQLLLENGADANLRMNNNATPLHLAAENGHTKVVQLLLEKDVETNLRADNNVTPLYAAAHNGHTEVVQLLLEKGADANLSRNDNTTPLYIAAQNGHTEVVRLLLKNNADANLRMNNNATPLHVAAQNGHTEVVQLLLENGVEPNPRANNDMTPLYLAAQNGRTEVVRLLLKNNADANLRMNNDATPLHVAAQNGHTEVVQLLLENGVEPNPRANNDATPLHLAAQSGRTKIVQLLLENGADANLSMNDNSTPLHLAAQNGHTEAVRLLLEKGAEPNPRENNDMTPLHLAAQNGHTEAVHLFLEKGAEPNPRENNDMTPLHLAAQSGHTEAVRLLLENGADANLRVDNNWTPLHLAAQIGHTGAVRLLLENGADANLRVDNNWTPLHLAAERSRAEVVEVLLQYNTPLGHYPSLKLCLDTGIANNASDKAKEYLENVKKTRIKTAVGKFVDLITFNALPKIYNKKKSTEALLFACQNNHVGLAKLALTSGAKFNKKNDHGLNSLDLAFISKNFRMIEIFLERDVNLNFIKNYQFWESDNEEFNNYIANLKNLFNDDEKAGRKSFIFACSHGYQALATKLYKKFSRISDKFIVKIEELKDSLSENNRDKAIALLRTIYWQNNRPYPIKRGHLKFPDEEGELKDSWVVTTLISDWVSQNHNLYQENHTEFINQLVWLINQKNHLSNNQIAKIFGLSQFLTGPDLLYFLFNPELQLDEERRVRCFGEAIKDFPNLFFHLRNNDNPLEHGKEFEVLKQCLLIIIIKDDSNLEFIIKSIEENLALSNLEIGKVIDDILNQENPQIHGVRAISKATNGKDLGEILCDEEGVLKNFREICQEFELEGNVSLPKLFYALEFRNRTNENGIKESAFKSIIPLLKNEILNEILLAPEIVESEKDFIEKEFLIRRHPVEVREVAPLFSREAMMDKTGG